MSGLAIRHGPVCCAKPGCSLEWPRDPILEAVCPASACAADARLGMAAASSTPMLRGDTAADKQDAYGTCPLGLCGLENAALLAGKPASARPAGAQTELPL